MAEFTNVAAQTVAANGNVVFSNTAVKGSNCIQHREGSGIITLRGLTNQCKARFFVDFSGNIAIPTGGTVGDSVFERMVCDNIQITPLNAVG